MDPHTHHHADHNRRAFLFGVALNVIYVAAEVIYGLKTDSLALVADAGHNLSDVLGLLLAWGAAWLAQLQGTSRRTYGWRRSTIYAALLNSLFMYVAVGGIGLEAVSRLISASPARTDGTIIMIVAGAGIGVNAATAVLFMAGRRKDLNIRGAFMHMAADAAVSAGVVLAGLGIYYTGWMWLDPAVSLAIGGVILIGSWGLMRDSVNLAMDAVPPGIDAGEIRAFLEDIRGVVKVHDLHIWAMSTTETALTAHLVHDDRVTDTNQVTARTGQRLLDEFGIGHSTLQWERSAAGEADDSGAFCTSRCDCECRLRR
jgi:cobalt-zinc-cadmium efflux system protein